VGREGESGKGKGEKGRMWKERRKGKGGREGMKESGCAPPKSKSLLLHYLWWPQFSSESNNSISWRIF